MPASSLLNSTLWGCELSKKWEGFLSQSWKVSLDMMVVETGPTIAYCPSFCSLQMPWVASWYRPSCPLITVPATVGHLLPRYRHFSVAFGNTQVLNVLPIHDSVELPVSHLFFEKMAVQPLAWYFLAFSELSHTTTYINLLLDSMGSPEVKLMPKRL